MAMGANLPGQGPETNDPIILDTDVDDIEPGYGQTGVYLKDGEWLSVKDGSFVLSGYPDISLGSEHTLYVLNEISSLSPIPLNQCDPRYDKWNYGNRSLSKKRIHQLSAILQL